MLCQLGGSLNGCVVWPELGRLKRTRIAATGDLFFYFCFFVFFFWKRCQYDSDDIDEEEEYFIRPRQTTYGRWWPSNRIRPLHMSISTRRQDVHASSDVPAARFAAPFATAWRAT